MAFKSYFCFSKCTICTQKGYFLIKKLILLFDKVYCYGKINSRAHDKQLLSRKKTQFRKKYQKHNNLSFTFRFFFGRKLNMLR